MQYVALDKLINLFDGYRQVFRINHLSVLLIQENGQRFAIQADCPHRDWPLQNGVVNGREIVCSKHGWSFDLQTGRPTHPMADCPLKTWPVSYQDNTIGIIISDG